jgi:hypothetical protein
LYCSINEGTEKDKEIAPVFLPSLQVAQCTSFGTGVQPVKKFTRSESKKCLENDLSKNNLSEQCNTILLILTFFFPVREREREGGDALIEKSEPSLIIQ